MAFTHDNSNGIWEFVQVSISPSRFMAFTRDAVESLSTRLKEFQSLHRDSWPSHYCPICPWPYYPRFNLSIEIHGLHTPCRSSIRAIGWWFQSLHRDSWPSHHIRRGSQIPQRGFNLSIEIHGLHTSRQTRRLRSSPCFNLSIEIHGLHTCPACPQKEKYPGFNLSIEIHGLHTRVSVRRAEQDLRFNLSIEIHGLHTALLLAKKHPTFTPEISPNKHILATSKPFFAPNIVIQPHLGSPTSKLRAPPLKNLFHAHCLVLACPACS